MQILITPAWSGTISLDRLCHNLLQNSPKSETQQKFETLFFLPAVNIFMSCLFSLKFSLCLCLKFSPVVSFSNMSRISYPSSHFSGMFKISPLSSHLSDMFRTHKLLTALVLSQLQFQICFAIWHVSFGTHFCLGCSLASIFGQFSIVSYSRCDLTLSVLRSKIYYLVVFQFQSGHLLVYFSFRHSTRQHESISQYFEIILEYLSLSPRISLSTWLWTWLM